MVRINRKIQGVITLVYFTTNTIFWTTLLFLVTFFRIIIPIKPWGRLCSRASNAIAENWTFFNNLGIDMTKLVEIEVEGVENLNRKGWYLVLANHQSWADIPILQKVFYRKIPMLKFFLKQELIWVPILGPAWWALDFPFMKRYSKDFLKKHPHLKGKDVEITRKACKKFKDIPVSIINFVEGTRYSAQKHKRQNSPFNNLLKPKAGGIGFVMTAMGDQLHSILNVTICYPEGAKEIWPFLCGDIKKVKVKVEQFPITDEIRGNYVEDREFRKRFQSWLNQFWTDKDAYIEQMKNDSPSSPETAIPELIHPN